MSVDTQRRQGSPKGYTLSLFLLTRKAPLLIRPQLTPLRSGKPVFQRRLPGRPARTRATEREGPAPNAASSPCAVLRSISCPQYGGVPPESLNWISSKLLTGHWFSWGISRLSQHYCADSKGCTVAYIHPPPRGGGGGRVATKQWPGADGDGESQSRGGLCSFGKDCRCWVREVEGCGGRIGWGCSELSGRGGNGEDGTVRRGFHRIG